jgi:hypothetical protein
MFEFMHRSIMSWIRCVIQGRACSSAEFRLYLLALALCVVGLTSWVVGLGSWKGALFWAAAACCATGFMLWASPRIRSAWRSGWGKVVVTFLHGLALLLALAFARELLADALGLPPQDFDWTERALTLFLWPAAWAVILAVVAALTQLWLVSTFALTHLLDTVSETLGFLSAMFTMQRAGTEKATMATDPEGPAGMRRLTVEVFVRRPNSLYRAGKPRDRSRRHLLCRFAPKEVRQVGRMFGVLVVTVAASCLQQGNVSVVRAWKPLVRKMAYYADYQSIPAYPGVRGNERVHLHENGVVSYAAMRGEHIEITVEQVAVAAP